MAAILNISRDDLYTEVRALLMELFPGNEVIQGYSNNVPLPKPPFILMNIINEADLSTNANDYSKENQIGVVSRTVQVMMQFDFFGNDAGNNARILANLWRDYFSEERLEKCKPLYCDQPKYMPLSNEKAEYEERWIVNAYLNFNPAVTHSQHFVTESNITTNLLP